MWTKRQENIGKVFLRLVRNHFPRSYKFNKIFNLNTNKMSYSSIPNVKNLIKQHNLMILSKQQDKIQLLTVELKKVAH